MGLLLVKPSPSRVGKRLISVHFEEVALDMPKLQTQQELYYISTTGTTSKPISSVVGRLYDFIYLP